MSFSIFYFLFNSLDSIDVVAHLFVYFYDEVNCTERDGEQFIIPVVNQWA